MYKAKVECSEASKVTSIIEKYIENKSVVSIKYLYGAKPHKIIIKVKMFPDPNVADVICDLLNRAGYRATIRPQKSTRKGQYGQKVFMQHYGRRAALKHRESIVEGRFRTIVVGVFSPNLPDDDTIFPDPNGEINES